MAQSSNATPYEVPSALGAAGDERWSPPQAALFDLVASAGLWALILAGARWLIA
jgi:hypothetical protein